MHLQIRTSTSKSPPDLAAVLQLLADDGINIEMFGGSDLEHRGGRFAFAVAHGKEERAMELLREYRPEPIEVKVCWLEDKPGELLRCILEARAQNELDGGNLVIRDLTIGAPDADGRVPVQVYSEPRRAADADEEVAS